MGVVRPLYHPLHYNAKFEKVDGGYLDSAGPNICACFFFSLGLCEVKSPCREDNYDSRLGSTYYLLNSRDTGSNAEKC